MSSFAALSEADRARVLAFAEEGRAAHAGLEDALDAAALAEHVAGQLEEGVPVGEQLAEMRPADLALAFACLGGSGLAIARFEAQCFEEIRFAHAKVRTSLGADEIAQLMRERLFLGDEGRQARIAQYSGKGDLRAWFRVVVTRFLLNTVRSAPKETALDEKLLDIVEGGADPEIAHARQHYGPALRDALTRAIGDLERRDRTLLRLAVCDGLTVDAIGAIYGVHRATAARWVAAARDELHVRTRESLRSALGAGDESIASLLRLLASQIDFSLRDHLVSAAEKTP